MGRGEKGEMREGKGERKGRERMKNHSRAPAGGGVDGDADGYSIQLVYIGV